MKRILIAYESVEGHTEKVAERIGATLRAADCEVATVRAKEVTDAAITGADGVLVGGSIHAGRHNTRLIRFAKAHRQIFSGKPTGLFLVCLTARATSGKGAADVAGYLEAFSEKTGVTPDLSRAFAGALVYTKYGFIKRTVMKSIAEKEGGDTDTSRDFVYTDWDAVEAFAREYAARLV